MRSCPEEGGVTETMRDELAAAPIPQPPALLQEEEEVEKLEVKLSLGKREM